ncbi:MAG TPA: serine protease [Ignavibacteria bacterium]|nr:serine protease [Ignavibacteria bacterium]HMR41532.1 serine protease [Ignavibacteria bacterium]
MKKLVLVVLICFKFVFIAHLSAQNNFDNKILTIEAPFVVEDTISKIVSVSNKPIGTAFIVGMSSYFKGKRFLVTARHVINEVIKNYDSELILRLPYDDSVFKSVRFRSNLNDLKKECLLYPKDTCYDLAIIEFSDLKGELVDKDTIDFEKLKFGAFPISVFKTSLDTLWSGNFITFAGYPKGLSGFYKNYLIFRFGIIAAVISDKFEELCKDHFLINSESTGGDSGSPVFSSNLGSTDKLIGVLSGSYFTGLSVVEPIEIVIEMIDQYLKEFGN